jgi:CheY-like chemotaxis protein
MDHMMPEMDGLSAAGLIKNFAPDNDGKNYQNLPIVMLTANAVTGQRELFLKSGINDFLSKPIDMRKLNTVLETWIPKGKQQELAVSAGERRAAEGGEEPAIPEIPGIHTGKGLENSGGSVNSYKRILSYFCKDADERIPQIGKAAEGGEFRLYATMVHAIKGASRSIGAMDLGQMAADLEAAGIAENSDAIREKTGDFLRDLRELSDRIRAVIAENTDTERRGDVRPRGGVPDISGTELKALKEALAGMETHALDRDIAQIRLRQPDSETMEYLNELEQNILLFEYEKAIAMIDKALAGGTHD